MVVMVLSCKVLKKWQLKFSSDKSKHGVENSLNFIFRMMDSKLASVMRERYFEMTVDSTMFSRQLKGVNMLKIAKKAIQK